MRGRSQDAGGMFSYIHPEKRIPAYHPLRKIRELVREVLKELYVREALLARRPTVDPARAAVKRADFAGALFGPLRAS